MGRIQYKITFLSPWLCASGKASNAGNVIQSVQDEDGLPYVSGRTLKGLVSEQLLLLADLSVRSEIERKSRQKMVNDKVSKWLRGCQFSNAELPAEERSALVASATQRYLYIVRSERNEEKGLLVEREAVVPCTLTGVIDNVPDKVAADMKEALCLIKRIGYRRQVGLGRCYITIEDGKESAQ